MEEIKDEVRDEIKDEIIEAEDQPEELTASEREELERLRKEKERNFKERLYDKINVSVKTMDRIIFVLVVLFLIVVIAGMYVGK